MNVKIKFLGAAKTVTGSKYLLEFDNNYKILIDCGLFQGLKQYRLRNWDPLPIDASEIDAILLTHAHIDHSGYLPRIVKEGFNGPIYCTAATATLLEILLKDAAKLQEEEANFARKKGYSKHQHPQPLFTTGDALGALGMLNSSDYGSTQSLDNGTRFSFHNAGHILGSAILQLDVQGKDQQKKLVFSGDIGRYDHPLLYDPEVIEHADILLVESTYGDKVNENNGMEQIFAQHINRGLERGGCITIPSFAVGRTQLLLYFFRELMEKGQIPKVPVYIDSPMAISTTALYKQFSSYHKLSPAELNGVSIFDYEMFHYYKSQEASIDLNNLKKNAIIISASGMCTGGRVLHHMFHRLKRKNDTLLFVGYQAEGTRGRRVLNGEPMIRIFGIDVEVKCHVDYMHGLSAHGDKNELLRWLGGFKEAPKMTFITHGEAPSSNAMAESIRSSLKWNNVIVPEYLESFELFRSI